MGGLGRSACARRPHRRGRAGTGGDRPGGDGLVASVVTSLHHLPPARAAALIAIASLASPVGHLAGGRAIDRAGRRLAGITQAALALLCIPAAIALVYRGPSVAIALGGVAALVLASGAGSVAGLAQVQRLVPLPVRGTANGVFLLLVAVAATGGGPLAVGLLADRRGLGVALAGFVTLVATIGAAAALGAIMVDRNRAGQAWR